MDIIDPITGGVQPGQPGYCQNRGTDFCQRQCDFWFDCFPEPKILCNRARCRKCGTIIVSNTTHDLQYCTCGAIAVDGGLEYIRRLGNAEDIEDLIEFAKTDEQKLIQINKGKGQLV